MEEDKCVSSNCDAYKDDGGDTSWSATDDEEHEAGNENADGEETEERGWIAFELVSFVWGRVFVIHEGIEEQGVIVSNG
jgi:hypothetical protein